MSDLPGSRLESALRELAADLHVPEPSDGFTTLVMERVATEPTPRRGGVRAWLDGRKRWLLALVVGLLVVGIGVSPVGAIVAEWFGFHGVIVTSKEPGIRGEPSVPTAGDTLTLDEAVALVDFQPRVPAELGEPGEVSVSRDRRLVSLSWGSGRDTIRLDEFDGTPAPYFAKTAPDARRISLPTGDALWFPTPHEVIVLVGGVEEVVPPRLGGQTLIWVRGGVTLRLEGSFGLGRASAIAASVD